MSKKGYGNKLLIARCLDLLEINADSTILDLGCGNGRLSRGIKKGIYYEGIDYEFEAIEKARAKNRNQKHFFTVADVTKKLPIRKKDFSHVVSILMLQKIRSSEGLFDNVNRHLAKGGMFLLIIYHPCINLKDKLKKEIWMEHDLSEITINSNRNDLLIDKIVEFGDDNLKKFMAISFRKFF